MLAVHCNRTTAKLRYLSNMVELEHEKIHMPKLSTLYLELSEVGAGVGGGFKSIDDLKVMNYKEVWKRKDEKHGI